MGANFYLVQRGNWDQLPSEKKELQWKSSSFQADFRVLSSSFTYVRVCVYWVLYVSSGGTEEAYVFGDFNNAGTLLASVGSSPDYMLTIWDWKQEKIMLRSKAFSQDVYKVTFSADNEEQLTTSGAGHIR